MSLGEQAILTIDRSVELSLLELGASLLPVSPYPEGFGIAIQQAQARSLVVLTDHQKVRWPTDPEAFLMLFHRTPSWSCKSLLSSQQHDLPFMTSRTRMSKGNSFSA